MFKSVAFEKWLLGTLRYDLSQVSDQLILHDIRTRNTKLMNDIFMLLAIDDMQILITASLMTHSPKELFMFYHCVFAFFMLVTNLF